MKLLLLIKLYLLDIQMFFLSLELKYLKFKTNKISKKQLPF